MGRFHLWVGEQNDAPTLCIISIHIALDSPNPYKCIQVVFGCAPSSVATFTPLPLQQRSPTPPPPQQQQRNTPPVRPIETAARCKTSNPNRVFFRALRFRVVVVVASPSSPPFCVFSVDLVAALRLAVAPSRSLCLCTCGAPRSPLSV